MLGLAEGCYESAVAYTRERKQFGKRICDFQVLYYGCVCQVISFVKGREFLSFCHKIGVVLNGN